MIDQVKDDNTSKAVVLLSGGLDSSTVLVIAKNNDYAIHALSIFYGQRNQFELDAAKRIAKHFVAHDHKIIELNLRAFGGSSLTGEESVRKHEECAAEKIPNTYVPARNTIMLSLALCYAESIGAAHVFYGANVHDYSGYPDCRPEYIEAFQNLANLATKSSVEGKPITIHAPLVNLTKAEIIKKGIGLGLDYSMTNSCYSPINNTACGKCSACFYRKKGFLEAGIDDPTIYFSPK